MTRTTTAMHILLFPTSLTGYFSSSWSQMVVSPSHSPTTNSFISVILPLA
jgi:hypothetical protein